MTIRLWGIDVALWMTYILWRGLQLGFELAITPPLTAWDVWHGNCTVGEVIAAYVPKPPDSQY